MKRIFCCAVLALAIVSCKKTEEVKVDETPVETPADSIVKDSSGTVSVEKTEVPAEVTPEPQEPAKVETSKDLAHYASFGAKIKADKALTKEQMLKEYKKLKKGDTIQVKFKSTIQAVCKKKGCWMEMELPEDKKSFVRFKDYGFFVPLNADDSEAIVSGKAFIDVVSVAELQHYAKDGGKSEEEIAKITEPKITYAFQADGVLIKE